MKKKNKLGKRFNQGKRQWSLVDFTSLESMVKVLEFGAKKYKKHNWKKGLPITEVCDSLLRHIYSFLSGEDNDKESGIDHIGHIQCNAMFLAFMFNNFPELDDRYKKQMFNSKKTSMKKGRASITFETKKGKTTIDFNVEDIKSISKLVEKEVKASAPTKRKSSKKTVKKAVVAAKKVYVRLEENQRKALRKDAKKEDNVKNLADKYNVSLRTAYRIINN